VKGSNPEEKGLTPLVQVPPRMEEEKDVINVIRVEADVLLANDATRVDKA
jgi:hypothetical protein